MRRQRPDRGAFTLVELLVVITILGLLATLLMPSFSRAKQIARRGVCQTNLHNVATAMTMYLEDSADRMPVASAMPSLKLNDEPSIADVLDPYLSTADTLRCPGDLERPFWQTEGSSYAYNTNLGGRTTDEGFLARRLGANRMPVMHDYEPFHGPAGTPGAANYLFADMHVGDIE